MAKLKYKCKNCGHKEKHTRLEKISKLITNAFVVATIFSYIIIILFLII